MYKLLIADASEPFSEALESILKNEFDLRICHDGEQALEYLLSFQPEVLILNLMLPFKDGLTALQESAHRPRVTLAITPYMNGYIEQVAASLGIQYIMIMPTVSALRVRLMDMIAVTITPKEDLAGQVVVHLHILGFPTHLDGYRQLCTGIPIYARDPNIRLSKDLYPAIAAHFDLPDSRTVEHSIRKAIAAAWTNRNPLVWERYFPSGECPSNKEFISRLAGMLEL